MKSLNLNVTLFVACLFSSQTPLEYIPPNTPSIDIIIGTDIKMDVRDMSDFQSGSFDVVIDKGIIIIALIHSSMEVTANICTCIWF
jgi:hypothetical protein